MKNNGGPAFPLGGHPDNSGMTLRDYFAAAALQGYLSSGYTGGWSAETQAQKAFEWADAMLTERNK